MARFNEKQVNEINLVIENIDKAIKKNGKKKYEIGSRDKTILLSLLKANKLETNRLFFPCKREYSEVIVSHFVNEKGLAKNKFSANTQENIYLLF
jgi:hypothetical protein